MNCPLCQISITRPFHKDKRCFHQCQNCYLVFVEPQYHLSLDLEKGEYDKHQNNPNDIGYREFLNKLVKPLNNRLPANSYGLDFGSGPGPTLAPMMQELGHRVENYDVFYSPNKSLLTKRYDFISCTEVVEHFYQPKKEFELLKKMLKPRAYLGIMTKRVIDQQRFATWHYKNDPTHVCFYHVKTFEYIAKKHSFKLEIINQDTVILRHEN